MRRLFVIATLALISTQVYAADSNFKKIDTVTYNNDQIHTYLHEQTDMTVKWVQNSDPKATFTLGVRTPTTDNTGVNHIIEHTVFTGSNKFPSSTLFFDANSNFPHTYMNASTAADYTMYPFQTPYEECFNGLLEVYLDSVLNPNMLTQPHSFYEESFYYDPDTKKYGGVVFNEMKGANSQIGRIIFRNIRNVIYEDTHYANDSGGQVNEIPTLTYKQFVDTYNNYYYPQNMMIALYGDLNIDKTLSIIDSYLTDYAENKPHDKETPPINVNVEPTLKYDNFTSTYNTGGESAYIIKSFVLPAHINETDMLELDLWLNTYLMDSTSDFKQNLLEAGIDSVEIFKDAELLRPIYSLIISQVAEEDIDNVKNILDAELDKLWNIEENVDLEQDTLQESKLTLAKDDISQDRGLDICHSIVASWVHEKDDLIYYKIKEYLQNIDDIDEEIGKELLQTADQVNLQVLPQKIPDAEVNPLTQSSVEPDRWPDLVASMRAWQNMYSDKVLEPTKLNNMVLGTDLKPKTSTKDNIKFTVYDTQTELLSTEIYLQTSHIPQPDLPYLFLYSYCLSEASKEITPFEGVLKSKIVALENEKNYTPYLKVEILTTQGINQQQILEKSQEILMNKDEEWFKLQLDKIVGEFYGNFQNDIIGTLSQLTNGAQSGYKRYIYEAHYPFYTFILNCKNDVCMDYISQTKNMTNRILPRAGSSIAVIGEKKEAQATLKEWKEYCQTNKLEKFDDKEYDFVTISKDSVYYKTGQVDYLLYNYDTKKDYVEAIDYLIAAYATKNYLQPEIRIKKGAYGSGMQVKFPNTISIYTYRDPHYKSSIDIIADMADMLELSDIEEKLRMAKSEALCDFQTQFGVLGNDLKKASILHAINLMGVDKKYIKHTQKEIVKIDAKDLEKEITNVETIVNDSKKGVCIKK
ncbi:MAG: hypothetical protein BEN18_06820 [Epulopiscium sp. Nuni2H_MBin001]|nr:MAG: hypothetical protein BEN18_06820 [Epulopiscium sp. Nuni2H_MBin001]